MYIAPSIDHSLLTFKLPKVKVIKIRFEIFSSSDVWNENAAVFK